MSCVSSGCLRFGDDVSAAYAPLYRDTRRWKRRQTGYSGFFNAFICDRIICETQCEANVAVESFLALARSCLNVCSIRYPAFAGLALCASLGIPRGRFQAPGRTHRFGGEIVRKCPRSVRTHQRRLGRGRRCERGTVSYQEPQVGIEPTTARLRIECSTTELLWPNYRRQTAEGRRQLLPSAVCRLPSRKSALARIRTETPYGTTPSRWRVYQFHHQGNPNAFTFAYSNNDPTTIQQRSTCDGSDGVRTRDLSSDSRVL